MKSTRERDLDRHYGSILRLCDRYLEALSLNLGIRKYTNHNSLDPPAQAVLSKWAEEAERICLSLYELIENQTMEGLRVEPGFRSWIDPIQFLIFFRTVKGASTHEISERMRTFLRGTSFGVSELPRVPQANLFLGARDDSAGKLWTTLAFSLLRDKQWAQGIAALHTALVISTRTNPRPANNRLLANHRPSADNRLLDVSGAKRSGDSPEADSVKLEERIRTEHLALIFATLLLTRKDMPDEALGYLAVFSEGAGTLRPAYLALSALCLYVIGMKSPTGTAKSRCPWLAVANTYLTAAHHAKPWNCVYSWNLFVIRHCLLQFVGYPKYRFADWDTSQTADYTLSAALESFERYKATWPCSRDRQTLAEVPEPWDYFDLPYAFHYVQHQVSLPHLDYQELTIISDGSGGYLGTDQDVTADISKIEVPEVPPSYPSLSREAQLTLLDHYLALSPAPLAETVLAHFLLQLQVEISPFPICDLRTSDEPLETPFTTARSSISGTGGRLALGLDSSRESDDSLDDSNEAETVELSFRDLLRRTKELKHHQDASKLMQKIQKIEIFLAWRLAIERALATAHPQFRSRVSLLTEAELDRLAQLGKGCTQKIEIRENFSTLLEEAILRLLQKLDTLAKPDHAGAFDVGLYHLETLCILRRPAAIPLVSPQMLALKALWQGDSAEAYKHASSILLNTPTDEFASEILFRARFIEPAARAEAIMLARKVLIIRPANSLVAMLGFALGDQNILGEENETFFCRPPFYLSRFAARKLPFLKPIIPHLAS